MSSISPDSKKLLILDLDETLVFTAKNESSLRDSADFKVKDHLGNIKFYGKKRSGLDAFLTFAFKHFDVALWSSSGEDYLSSVTKSIFQREQPIFTWGRGRCTRRFYHEMQKECFLKKLSKIFRKKVYRKEHVLIIDNSPDKCQLNYGNYIRCHSFLGEKNDRELFKLQSYLSSIKDEKNWRSIEKRFWRDEINDCEF